MADRVNELADKGFELAPPDADRCQAGSSFEEKNNMLGSCGAGQPLYRDPKTGWIVCYHHWGWPQSDDAKKHRSEQKRRGLIPKEGA